MIAYTATLDVPGNWPGSWRSYCSPSAGGRGTPRGSRALTCFWQAVLGLRWFRDRTSADALARDHGISRATAYRYLGEVIAVLAARVPDLRDALERASKDGFSHVILDGKIIACDRCKEPAISVKGEVIDLWYSGNRTADLADKEAALAAHPDSFFTIPHLDGYRAVLIRLPQVTGAALREAITDGWLACAPPGSPGISSPASQPPSCHPIGRHDSVALDREC